MLLFLGFVCSFFQRGKKNKPSCNTWFKTKLGLTKFGYYASIYAREKAEKRLDQAIQALKTVEIDENGTFTPVRDAATHTQEEDPEMNMYRLPIFAFVTFNLEAQQQFIKKTYDERDTGLWKRFFKVFCCGKTDYALTLYREHVEAIGKTSPYLVHPLPADTPADVRQQTAQLAHQLLENATVEEAEEPSDIDWTKQGFLTGKMPLGDPDLSWSPRPGSTNKYFKKRMSNILSYVIAMVILALLFGLLLLIETQANRFRASLKSGGSSTYGARTAAYLDQAVGWILAGTVTIINAALPVSHSAWLPSDYLLLFLYSYYLCCYYYFDIILLLLLLIIIIDRSTTHQQVTTLFCFLLFRLL